MVEETTHRKWVDLFYRLSTVNESAHSVISDDDIDYWDKTEENIDTPCRRKRRSKRLRKTPTAPPADDLNETPPKRSRSGNIEVCFVTSS